MPMMKTKSGKPLIRSFNPTTKNNDYLADVKGKGKPGINATVNDALDDHRKKKKWKGKTPRTNEHHRTSGRNGRAAGVGHNRSSGD